MTRRAVPGPEQPAPVRDTAVIRALAHPARLALLSYLGHSGPATATECAGVVDLSPSAVSYHLRALARAGLIEAAPGRGDGRERRWRRTAERDEVASLGDLDPGTTRALLESLLAWDQKRARRFADRAGAEPAAWQDAAFFMDTALIVTAEELTALGRSVQELLAPYRQGTRADPPAAARPVSATVRAFPV